MRARGAANLVCALLLTSSAFAILLTTSAFAILLTTSAFALDVPPPPTRWFTDNAGLVSPTDADLLNRKLSDFEQSSGAQFIIYTLPSLEGDAPEDFAIRCARQWGVGQKKYNNGLILFVFAKERKTRVEVGYGLEGSITDAFSSRVMREFLTPAFQQQKYAEGLNAAADAIMQKIRTGEEPVAPLQPSGGAGQTSSGDGEIGPQAVIFILVIVFFVILPMLSRRRGGGCNGCLLPLFLSGGGRTFGGGGFSGGGFSGGGFGGGGFSGGGGGFGGGGATGGW